MMLLALAEAMSIFLVIAYAYCKSPAYRPLEPNSFRARDKLFLFVFFTAVSIMGTYLGLPVRGAIANTRALGTVLAGLIGGPFLGTAVGAAAGLHRYTVGGFTAFTCGLATAVEGLMGGLVHLYVVKRLGSARLCDPKIAFATTLVAEATQMVMILLMAHPHGDAVALVKTIAIPVMVANSAGAALFMSVLRDRMNMYDEAGAPSGARALRIAERTLRLVSKGLNREVAGDIAKIIHEETGVRAVAITDADKVLAFVGAGADHHHSGTPIESEWTRKAIAASEVTFDTSYGCVKSKTCPLHSVLVLPLLVDGEVLGTIELYETANKFLESNRMLGEGLTSLLSSQLLLARYQEQKHLLVMAELKLARAQLNPHFLFNSLNTIMAMLDHGSRPHQLLAHLSNFFRENLKRGGDLSTIREELEHVNAYLEIAKARFEDRLSVEIDVDPSLLDAKVPTFTLQPLIENAIKHGISEMLTPGIARIHIYRLDGAARIDIEDNAGTYEEERLSSNGLGIKIVEKRIEGLLGRGSRLDISCVRNELTRVSIQVPAPEEPSLLGDGRRPQAGASL
jgi:two-component system LytT family sensor kinase